MSASLLSDRLRRLEMAELVEKRPLPDSKGSGYYPTDAAQELKPIIMEIGVWGLKYMKTHFDTRNLDPSLLMWDMRRWIQPDDLPPGRVVIRIDLTNAKKAQQRYWLVKDEKESNLDLCLHDPGYDVDLVVTTDIESMARVWLGNVDVQAAVRTRRIKLDGSPTLRLSFYDWIGLSPFAHDYP